MVIDIGFMLYTLVVFILGFLAGAWAYRNALTRYGMKTLTDAPDKLPINTQGPD